MRIIAAVIALAATITPAIADPCEATLPANGTTFSGPVTYIVDGDGLCVGPLPNAIEVRLGDFNAVELHDKGGAEAKAALEQIAMGKTVACVADHKSYDRIVAVCSLGGKPLGDLMREQHIAEGGN